MQVRYLCLTLIHVTSQPHPVQPKLHLNSIQAPSQNYSTFYVCVSPYIPILYQLYPGHKLIV